MTTVTSSNIYLRRFGGELTSLQEQYHDNISCIIDKSTSTIRISFDNSRIRVILPQRYPFIPPRVYLESINAKNNLYWNFLRNYDTYSQHHMLIPYKQSLDTSSYRIKQLLWEHYNIQCLCCSNMTNDNLWLPTYDLTRVLKSIHEHNKIRQHVKYLLLLNIIMEYKNMPEVLVFLIMEYLQEK